MKKLSKADLKKINGGNILPGDSNGKCQTGWFLCPTNVCVNDKGGEDPIVPGHPKYSMCFGS